MARSTRGRSFTVSLGGSASGIPIGSITSPDFNAPAGPTELAFADFVNGVYRVNGATATVDDIFKEDLAWSSWEPAVAITPGTGWANGDETPVIADALNTAWLADGVTLVITFASPLEDESGSISVFALDLATSTFEHQARVRVYGFDYRATWTGVDSDILTYAGGAAHIMAVTLTPTHVAVSVDGGAVAGLDGTPEAVDRIGFGLASSGSPIVQTITFHPPQDDAALPGLST